jgi:hypothetical protein
MDLAQHGEISRRGDALALGCTGPDGPKMCIQITAHEHLLLYPQSSSLRYPFDKI